MKRLLGAVVLFFVLPSAMLGQRNGWDLFLHDGGKMENVSLILLRSDTLVIYNDHGRLSVSVQSIDLMVNRGTRSMSWGVMAGCVGLGMGVGFTIGAIAEANEQPHYDGSTGKMDTNDYRPWGLVAGAAGGAIVGIFAARQSPDQVAHEISTLSHDDRVALIRSFIEKGPE
jgi:hypothetical protein